MPAYPPDRGLPPDEVPEEPPAQEEQPEEQPVQEQTQEVPTDNLNAPMAGALQQASPEEQDMADQFVGRAWQLIYDDTMFPKIIEMLRGGADDRQEGDPVHGLAQATDLVVARVGDLAEQSGQELIPDVVFHAAGDILEELAEISRRARIKDYSQDPDALEAAWFQALDIYRERLEGAGVIDKQHAQADFDKLIAADKDGTYEKIMRDLAASDESGPAGGPEPPPDEMQAQKPKGFNAAMGV